MELHVVLGGSGGAGNAIVRALAGTGQAVRSVSRSGQANVPDGVQRLAADVTELQGAQRAVAGAGVVYMAAQPEYHRWPEQFPQMLEGVVAATASQGARLVMVDNLYDYGPGSSPMSESTPRRATDTKGRVRAQMVADLLQAHQSGRLSVTIGKASDYFGPRCTNSGISALAIEPAAAGKRIRWVGSLDAPHSCAYLPDIARAYVLLGTHPEASGRVWHLPHEPAVTGSEFLTLVNHALPSPLPTGRVGVGMLRMAAPFHRISRETLGIAYQWTDPFVVDDSSFRAAFDFQGTPLALAVSQTLAEMPESQAQARV